MEEYTASWSFAKVHTELRMYPRSRHQRVMPSKSARFSPFPIACTVLDVKVKSMKG